MDERRRLQAEIERDFARYVIHQVKTPLALIHGYASTLLERDLPEEQRTWFLNVIAEQSLDLSRALDRLEEVRGLPEQIEGEWARVGQALEEASGRARRRLPDLEVILPGGPGPAVAVEHGWLVRAFEEVMEGSLAHREKRGTVRIEVEEDSSDLTVNVKFSVARDARLADIRLYLVRRIAEHFGGSYSAETGLIRLSLPVAAG